MKTNALAATPNVFNRKADVNDAGLGPLAALANGNQWIGDTGFNLMVVPRPGVGFLVMISPLFETHHFEVSASAPNRSAQHGTAQNTAIKYSQTVAEKNSKNILHEENGMWLNQTPGTLAEDGSGYGLQHVDPATTREYLSNNPLLRSGTIPHGNTIHAIGNWSAADLTPPASGDVQPFIKLANFQNNGSTLEFLPMYADGSDPTDLHAAYLSQIKQALEVVGRSDLSYEEFINPIGLLNAQAKDVTHVVSMAVSTENGHGGVLNVPFERAFAHPRAFICTFMIETVLTPGFKGNASPTADERSTFMQLQYLQSIPMFIPKGFNGKDVIFPHWNVNTLIAV
ncbi:hypothetical protein GTP81_08585 [Rugamonas sp. FT107W]|uniref:Uncharacterized protein n=1 Tax=Duganella vulcania TaxID=2692166 RepID=A0A845HEU1_9BURK|nr:hypothetical protein [Duganella vulcania]MYN16807.1 hypothetical protein [Duganella vulcania]